MTFTPERALYFDATFLRFAHDLRGVPQVIVQLIRFLEEVTDFPPVRYLVTPDAAEKFLRPLGVADARIRYVRPLPILGRYERFHGLGTTWLYRRLRRVALGIIHPEPRTVVSFAIPQWVLLYDLIILERALSGEKSPHSRRWLYRRKLMRLIHVTISASISAYTADRVRQYFPEMPKGQPTPLWLGIRKNLHAAAPGARPTLPVRIGISGENAGPLRLLYVGSYDARKHVTALVQALPGIAEKAGQGLANSLRSPPRIELHLAGHLSAERREALVQAAQDWPRSLTLSIHGLVTEAQLVELYTRAHFFVFPSLFEGFGLPVMEAMAFGVPVFAFRNSSLPEIAGDAACLTETGDFSGWGERMGEALASPGQYDEWVERVRQRATLFTERAMCDRYVGHWRGFLDRVQAEPASMRLGRSST